jgi:Rrf2 family protein
VLAQSTGYAASALGFVAAGGGTPVQVRQIAASCDIPAPFLAKIVNALARTGVVTTQRGIGGGVTLAKPATDICLYDLCVALDDPIIHPRCMLGVDSCSDERACPAHAFARDCRRKVLEFLQRTTIADLASFEARRRWNNAPRPLLTPTVGHTNTHAIGHSNSHANGHTGAQAS